MGARSKNSERVKTEIIRRKFDGRVRAMTLDSLGSPPDLKSVEEGWVGVECQAVKWEACSGLWLKWKSESSVTVPATRYPG